MVQRITGDLLECMILETRDRVRMVSLDAGMQSGYAYIHDNLSMCATIRNFMLKHLCIDRNGTGKHQCAFIRQGYHSCLGSVHRFIYVVVSGSLSPCSLLFTLQRRSYKQL